MVMFLADGIEALVGLSHLDRAEHLTRDARTRCPAADPRLGSRAGRALPRAAARCARRLGAAALAAHDACRLAERLELRLEYARTLLVAGEIERRSRRRRPARDLCGRALEIFEAAGAQRWADRARAELNRAARRLGEGLTESEKLMADLAASGLTNRQVAARLFNSPKTVEANLARVYRKLGIRSRAELGARIASPESEPL